MGEIVNPVSMLKDVDPVSCHIELTWRDETLMARASVTSL